MSAKTGSEGQPWVDLEQPRPPRAARGSDVERYWTSPPPEMSERCAYWLRQIERGWLPNRRISMEGYYSSAEWYGVFIWEYINEIFPAVDKKRAEVSGHVGTR